jgi:hypothetical protein
MAAPHRDMLELIPAGLDWDALRIP